MRRRKVGIVGYGRFGRLWADLLAPHHQVSVTDKVPLPAEHFLPLPALCAAADVIFLCVPINQVEQVVREIGPHLKRGTAVFDTCSVKVHPASVLTTQLGQKADVSLIATHPMFGPDSAAHGVHGLPMVVWRLAGNEEIYREWVGFFDDLGIRTVEMAPDEHDRLAAYSQGITHYVGRVLRKLDLQPTLIDTQGFKLLHSLTEQTCNDSWELFHDLQIFNPYTREMRLRLESALDSVYEELLPERVSPDHFVVAVQGGRGSFNEQACRYYGEQHSDEYGAFEITYRYTTENVLRALHEGEADFGVFAIQNARGGAVMETIDALSHYTCEIIEAFELLIGHALLLHPDAPFEQVDTVISHPQALAQCRATLAARYPHLQLTSGQGELIDQALCARYIAEGRLPRTTAVLAPEACAQLYGLRVHDRGLQDLDAANLTTFAWARRRSGQLPQNEGANVR
jgi:prephenate dehydrogenase/prephenate dehydratase